MKKSLIYLIIFTGSSFKNLLSGQLLSKYDKMNSGSQKLYGILSLKDKLKSSEQGGH